MIEASDVWNPRDVKQLTTALTMTAGQTVALGESIRLTVVRIGRSKIRFRIKAPESMKILRGKMYWQEIPPIKPLRSARPQPKAWGLCLTLRLGEWASVGDEVFVGVSRVTDGRIILGFKVPQSIPVCDEDVWKSLNGPSRDGMVQM
jgi:sRNA-binding carbon storage regulator CsrA